MHELGIVKDIFRTLEEAYPDRYESIVKINLEAGLLSSLQPILIQNAFEAYVMDDTRFKNTELEVSILPIIAYCKNCDKQFEVKYHRFVCECGQPSDTIIQGEELRISQVTFQEDKNE
ncbi:hydrogenase maturation nickel metallochaperone HypA [Sphingobacterium sp. SGR-19]|uniref:hydrogenase maturation nickel metallochaperone HypA/HybF n=1 Tax=Sphingobacterium sp. SGR-19 TaxID=2710886 RepID=UPI0013EA0094|nr:hydrogenase maturation nickel metallochaperone HypA [Sphingobacterium sp. SGR-19]NGM63992.1 hydrogenase maturation nickel metallochaperone HypA [Sphingobacterium sp. SGR-19]